jgi:hypothetical protein
MGKTLVITEKTEMHLEPKALAAAVEAYNAFELGSDVDHVRKIVSAYLAARKMSLPSDA